MRVVIHLIYFEDLSYDEAGKVMKKKAASRWITFCIVPKRSFASFLERMVSCYYEKLLKKEKAEVFRRSETE